MQTLLVAEISLRCLFCHCIAGYLVWYGNGVVDTSEKNFSILSLIPGCWLRLPIGGHARQ